MFNSFSELSKENDTLTDELKQYSESAIRKYLNRFAERTRRVNSVKILMKYTNTGGDLGNLLELCDGKGDTIKLEDGSEIKKFYELCSNIEDGRRDIEFFISYQKCVDELKVSETRFITSILVFLS